MNFAFGNLCDASHRRSMRKVKWWNIYIFIFVKNETDSTILWCSALWVSTKPFPFIIFVLFAVYQILSIRRTRIDDTQEERNKIDYIQSRKFSFVNLILFANWTNIILFEQVYIMYSSLFPYFNFYQYMCASNMRKLAPHHTFNFLLHRSVSAIVVGDSLHRIFNILLIFFHIFSLIGWINAWFACLTL